MRDGVKRNYYLSHSTCSPRRNYKVIVVIFTFRLFAKFSTTGLTILWFPLCPHPLPLHHGPPNSSFEENHSYFIDHDHLLGNKKLPIELELSYTYSPSGCSSVCFKDIPKISFDYFRFRIDIHHLRVLLLLLSVSPFLVPLTLTGVTCKSIFGRSRSI